MRLNKHVSFAAVFRYIVDFWFQYFHYVKWKQ